MKYIDADKLIAEIERKRDSALERQKNLEKIGQETVLNEMIAFELNRLISFVASLQQKQSEFNIPSAGSGARGTTPPKFKLEVKEQPEELEEEMDEIWLEFCEDVDYLVYASIARHFAEWGAEHTKQKPELVQHPAIGYMYNADAGRGEQMKQAILALLKSDLIQVAGRGFTKTELIEWIETRPAEMKEDEK